VKVLIIDNYDSFTYNLYHYCLGNGREVEVRRNDLVSDHDLDACDRIVLSPGPGLPADAGRMPEIIKSYCGKKPILGICLGLQAIAESFGGELYNLHEVLHGQSSLCKKTQEGEVLFKGLGNEFEVGHYHSWIVKSEKLPDDLEITAINERGYIMALRHRYLDVRGVQFHPESVLTPGGRMMMNNWLNSN
jgi:anthranilate synthase component II